MPITVSLEQIVSMEGTRSFWPAEFEKLIRALEKKQKDSTLWGAVADWLDENGEPTLAGGFRWMSKHPEVSLYKREFSELWEFRALPQPLQVSVEHNAVDTIPGLMLMLDKKLKVLKKTVEGLL